MKVTFLDIGKINTSFSAKMCESYTKRFPILFPECSITRKQHVLSIVAPKQIRQQQIVYKILKLVERGENLHCKLNKLDRQYVNMLNNADIRHSWRHSFN